MACTNGQELMILGLISFCLFVVDYNTAEHGLSETTSEVLDVCSFCSLLPSRLIHLSSPFLPPHPSAASAVCAHGAVHRNAHVSADHRHFGVARHPQSGELDEVGGAVGGGGACGVEHNAAPVGTRRRL